MAYLELNYHDTQLISIQYDIPQIDYSIMNNRYVLPAHDDPKYILEYIKHNSKVILTIPANNPICNLNISSNSARNIGFNYSPEYEIQTDCMLMYDDQNNKYVFGRADWDNHLLIYLTMAPELLDNVLMKIKYTANIELFKN